MIYFLITLLICYTMGCIANKFKIPGAFMVGSIIGAAALSIGTDIAYMPSSAKVFAQIIAGTFIATTVKKDDIRRLRTVLAPLLILACAYLFLTAIMGFLIHYVSKIDLLTSLMACIPGGISDVTIIAAEMGADAPKIAVLQFVRLVVGIGIFPTIIAFACENDGTSTNKQVEKVSKTNKTKLSSEDIKKIGITLIIGTISGIIGKISKIPAGTLVFAMLGVLFYILLGHESYIPRSIKKFAQVLAGAYIGCTINYSDVLQMKILLMPILIIIIGYMVNCFLMGVVLHKACKIPRREAMLMATPAGASDMALISNDLGVDSPNLVVIQIFRLILTVTVFPQYVQLIMYLVG